MRPSTNERDSVGEDMTRILVTGSRDWDDWQTLTYALFDAVDDYGEVVVVHGQCPTGADAMADWVGENLLPFLEVVSARVERHPAKWSELGKRGGFVRNAEMVNLGADVCLAFIKNGSRGASHTADLAEKAGIPVRRFTA